MKTLDTKQFALIRGYSGPDSVRTILSKQGHVDGIVPAKLPNGRLAWPARETLKETVQ